MNFDKHVYGTPLSSTSPFPTVYKPEISDPRVDFPQPDLPHTMYDYYEFSYKEKFVNTGVVEPWYANDTFCNSSVVTPKSGTVVLSGTDSSLSLLSYLRTFAYCLSLLLTFMTSNAMFAVDSRASNCAFTNLTASAGEIFCKYIPLIA